LDVDVQLFALSVGWPQPVWHADTPSGRGPTVSGMTLGIVVFGALILVGLALGTSTRRPLATAGVVVGAFAAVLVAQAHEAFAAFSTFTLIALVGLVADSVRETVRLLLDR
jgi:hypothetical protein